MCPDRLLETEGRPGGSIRAGKGGEKFTEGRGARGASELERCLSGIKEGAQKAIAEGEEWREGMGTLSKGGSISAMESLDGNV